MSHSEEAEAFRIGIVNQYAKADLYYQTLNIKTVEEEAVYNVKYICIVIDLLPNMTNHNPHYLYCSTTAWPSVRILL